MSLFSSSERRYDGDPIHWDRAVVSSGISVLETSLSYRFRKIQNTNNKKKLDRFFLFFFKCLPTKWARLWSVWFTLGATRLDVWRSADGHMAVNEPRDVMHERSIWCRSAGGSVTPGPRLDWDVRGWCGCVQCVPLNEPPPVADLPWTKTRCFFPFFPQYNFLMNLRRVTITLHLLDKNGFPFLLSDVPWSDKFDYVWLFE